MHIVGVCGSLSPHSANLDLLQELATLVGDDATLTLSDHLRGLPLFYPQCQATEAVRAWRQALASADAVVIASPEYGHSLPGALKNGIDWVIGSGELYRKRVALTARVPAAERGLRGLAALAQTLAAVEAELAWNAPIVTRNSASELPQLLRALEAPG